MDPSTDSFVDTVKEFLYDSVEIVSTLNSLIDAVKIFLAFLFEFVQWLYIHPVWGILWEHLKIGKDFLIEIFAPFEETGEEIIEDYAVKINQVSIPTVPPIPTIPTIPTYFYFEDDCQDKDFWNYVITISVTISGIVMTGLLLAFFKLMGRRRNLRNSLIIVSVTIIGIVMTGLITLLDSKWMGPRQNFCCQCGVDFIV